MFQHRALRTHPFEIATCGIIDAGPFRALTSEERRCQRRARGRLMIYVMYLVVGVAVAGLLYLVVRDALDRRRTAVKHRRNR